MVTRRFLGISITNLSRWRLVDTSTGKVYAPSPALAETAETPFEQRWAPVAAGPLLQILTTFVKIPESPSVE